MFTLLLLMSSSSSSSSSLLVLVLVLVPVPVVVVVDDESKPASAYCRLFRADKNQKSKMDFSTGCPATSDPDVPQLLTAFETFQTRFVVPCLSKEPWAIKRFG